MRLFQLWNWNIIMICLRWNRVLLVVISFTCCPWYGGLSTDNLTIWVRLFQICLLSMFFSFCIFFHMFLMVWRLIYWSDFHLQFRYFEYEEFGFFWHFIISSTCYPNLLGRPPPADRGRPSTRSTAAPPTPFLSPRWLACFYSCWIYQIYFVSTIAGLLIFFLNVSYIYCLHDSWHSGWW